jgi:hypothetical protein
MVKPSMIKLILTIVVIHGWFLHQLDVNNVFLHRTLKGTISMHQPPRFVDPVKLWHVCRLKKSIYYFKQTPRQWFYSLCN